MTIPSDLIKPVNAWQNFWPLQIPAPQPPVPTSFTETERRDMLAALPLAQRLDRDAPAIAFHSLDRFEPLADALERIARAKAERRPLDLAGQTVRLDLAGLTLDVTGLTIRNGVLELKGLQPGGLALSSRPEPRLIATNWTGGKRGDVRIHMPGHGLTRGSIIWIYGTENWVKSRYYLMSGDVSNVLEVDGDYLILGRPLRFGYDQIPAEKVVGVRPEEFSRFRLENLHIRYTGPESVYGVWHRYSIGHVIDNVAIEGFRQTLMYTEDCIGYESAYQPMGLNGSDAGGTNYGHMLNGLYLWSSTGYNGLGGRHILSHGGNYPGEAYHSNGRFYGGYKMTAVDAHPGQWLTQFDACQIHGGVTLGAMHTRVNNSEIQHSHEVNAAVLLFSGAPAGATADFVNTHTRKNASAGNTPSFHIMRSTGHRRSATEKDVPFNDEVMGRFSYIGGSITHERGSVTGGDDVVWNVDATIEEWAVDTVERVKAGSISRSGRIAYDRLRHIRHKTRGNSPTAFRPSVHITAEKDSVEDAMPLKAAPLTFHVDIEAQAVGMNGASDVVAVTVDSNGGIKIPELRIKLWGRGNSSLLAYLRGITTAFIEINSATSAQTTATNSYKAALGLNDVNQAFFNRLHIDERHTNCKYGIYADASSALYADTGRIKAPVQGVFLTGNSVMPERGQLREAVGGATWPTLRGTYTQAGTPIAAGSSLDVVIPVPGAAAGDIGQINGPALAAGLVASPPRTGAGTVTVTITNTTQMPVSHGGVWTARVSRS